MYNRHLDILMMVVEKGSFAKAAEALFISSTAVMKQINLLEDELGVVLFKRTNHGVELTEEGKSIYQDAKKIIRLSQQAIEKAKQMGQKTIRIGSSSCARRGRLWKYGLRFGQHIHRFNWRSFLLMMPMKAICVY